MLTECGGDGDEGRHMKRVRLFARFVRDDRARGFNNDDQVHGAHPEKERKEKKRGGQLYLRSYVRARKRHTGSLSYEG